MPGLSVSRLGVAFKSGLSWPRYWSQHYLTGLVVTTTSDTTQTITATIVGTGADGVSWEYSTDGITYSVKGTSVLGSYSATGLTPNTLYYWRARLYKGTHYGNYSNVINSTTFGVGYAVLSNISNGKYNWYASMDQVPGNPDKVLMTYQEDANHIAEHTNEIKLRISTDKGKTFGTASTLYHPAGSVLCIVEHHCGFTSDGRFHILIGLIDDVSTYSLIYLYSDNDGTSFTELDITALVTDVTYVSFAPSSHLIENNGVLMGGFYAVNAAGTSSRRSVLRLVSGSWTKVDVETTAAYENEIFIEVLSGNNLIALVRDDVIHNSYIQYNSADNGLTWIRLGKLDFASPDLSTSSVGQLTKFKIDRKSVV